MNTRKLIIGALLVAMLVLAYAPAMPAKAQTQAVTVLTQTVTTNSRIYFYVNLTYLRSALGWVGTTVNLYLSTNGFATTSGDIKVNAQPIYVANSDYIAGTIIVNQTVVQQLLNNQSGYLYLKVSDGSNTAASNRFYVVTNITDVIKMNTLNLSYINDTAVNSVNFFSYYLNLTNITTTDLTTLNISVELVAGSSSLQAFYYPAGDINNATSQIFNLTYKNVTASTVEFNGTLLDFALPTLNNVVYVNGKPVNFTSFMITMKGINESAPVDLTGYSTAVVKDNNFVYYSNSYILENVTLNIGSINTKINIFPTIEINYSDMTITGLPTELNPGDVLNITIHQFVDATNASIVTCFFNSNTGAKVASVTETLNVANGTVTFNVTIPQAPFGGQETFVMVKEITSSGLTMRGLPATTTVVVKPYIDVAFVKNDGTFSTFNSVNVTAPGDYVLIKGYGFLQNDNITVSTYYNGAYIDNLPVVLDVDGDQNLTVNQSGMFFAIFRMPVPANTSITNFTLVAHGDTTGDAGTSLITFNYQTGPAVAKVFVNPLPTFVNTQVWNESAAKIVEQPVTEGYPYEVPWTTGGTRLFCLEVIGVDFATGYAALNMTNTTFFNAVVNDTNAVNFTTQQGYFRAKMRIPVAPYGDFNVTVFNASNTNDNYTTYEPLIHVNNTLRAIDPVALQINGTINYTTIVFIGTPTNLTVVGYGWPAGAQLNMTIAKSGTSLSNTTVLVTSVPTDGYINTTAIIAPFLQAHGNGTYTVTIYDTANTSIKAVITVYYSITPPVTIKVLTGTLKLVKPGDTVDVYVIVNLGDTPADGNQLYKSSVTVKVYYYENGTTLELYKSLVANYTGEPGIWATSFTVNSTLKNTDLLIKVVATIQPKFYNIPQTATDYASLSVAGGLQDLLDQIANGLANATANIADIMNELRAMNATITGLVLTKSGELMAEIQTAQGQILASLNAAEMMIMNNITVNTQMLLASLAQLQAQAAEIGANVTVTLMTVQAMQQMMATMGQQVLSGMGQLALEIEAYGQNITILLNKTLDTLNAVIYQVNNNTAMLSSRIGKMEMNLTELIKGLNATVTGLICKKSGEMMALIQTIAGNLTATIQAAEKMMMDNMTVNVDAVMKSIANLNATMQAEATQILNALGVLNTTMMSYADTLESKLNKGFDTLGMLVSQGMNSLSNQINNSNSKLEGMIDSLSNQVNNSSMQIANLVKDTQKSVQDTITAVQQVNKGVNDVNTKLDTLQNTVVQKLDTLQKTVEQGNNAVKSRTTTLTGVSTIILLAAIFGVAFMRKP